MAEPALTVSIASPRNISSVAEVAGPGDQHRAAGRIGGGDHVGVAHRAARLDEGA